MGTVFYANDCFTYKKNDKISLERYLFTSRWHAESPRRGLVRLNFLIGRGLLRIMVSLFSNIK